MRVETDAILLKKRFMLSLWRDLADEYVSNIAPGLGLLLLRHGECLSVFGQKQTVPDRILGF